MERQSDLAPFLKRQLFEAHEERQSCRGYAYSVDLRRARWILHSSFGNPFAAIIDRAWPQLTEHLEQNELLNSPSELEPEFFGRVERLRKILGAPRPRIRFLNPERAQLWPAITPFGARPNTARWLVLDPQRLGSFAPDVQDFLIASALGHLHCEHGVLFSAHYLAQSFPDFGLTALQTLLRPWSSIIAFSADRAGMMGCASLASAISGLRAQIADEENRQIAAFLPRPPSESARQEALEEFARSVPFLRSRSQSNQDTTTIEGSESDDGQSNSADSSSGPQGIPDDAFSIARCDQRLTQRLKLY